MNGISNYFRFPFCFAGLTFSNELISRDEGLHADFGCLLYSMLENRLTTDVLNRIVREAVDVEKAFICDALPCDLIGMNSSKFRRRTTQA